MQSLVGFGGEGCLLIRNRDGDANVVGGEHGTCGIREIKKGVPMAVQIQGDPTGG